MKTVHLPHARRGPLASAGTAGALAAACGRHRGQAQLAARYRHRPARPQRRATNLRIALGVLAATVAIGGLGAPAASAVPKDMGGVVVPKPTGKLVPVAPGVPGGGGVTVRLEQGWTVRSHGRGTLGSYNYPVVELAYKPLRALVYVYDLGPSSYSVTQLLQLSFPKWLSSEDPVKDVQTGAAYTFSIGPGGVFDEGAGEGFTGTATTSWGEVYQERGVGYALKDSSTNLAVVVFAGAEASNYIAALQGQLEGMMDSIVSPGNP